MRVRSIGLKDFMSHKHTEVTLPESGVVVVTGPNGAGKSALVESVAMAGWGKTLRGTRPWAHDGANDANVKLAVDGLLITRNADNPRLRWAIQEDGTEAGAVFDSLLRLGAKHVAGAVGTFENTTKAQEALERLIGPFDVWRRGCAFSASDAAHFSTATDTERKRLLEAILQLDRFDVALGLCRNKLKAFADGVSKRTHEIQRMRDRLVSEELRLLDAQRQAQADLDALPPALPDPPMDERARVGAMLVTLRTNERNEKQRRDDAMRAEANFNSQISQGRRELERLAVDSCPTCLQPIPAALREDARKQILLEDADLRSKAAEKKRQYKSACDALEELSEEAQALEARNRKLTWDVEQHDERRRLRETAITAHKAAQQRAVEIADNVARLGVDIKNGQATFDEMKKELVELEQVEIVLGFRGVRAHLLQQSLAAISAIANARLQMLGLEDLTVDLLPYKEQKTAGVVDAISIVVGGAGGGLGYKAASAGERRRIDFALLLGLSEVASGSTGRRNSTLFFDELFDALDSDGVNAVARALEDLAAERCIVVITHNDELAARIRAVKRIVIDNGTIGDANGTT